MCKVVKGSKENVLKKFAWLNDLTHLTIPSKKVYKMLDKNCKACYNIYVS